MKWVPHVVLAPVTVLRAADMDVDKSILGSLPKICSGSL